eukprot:183114_1
MGTEVDEFSLVSIELDVLCLCNNNVKYRHLLSPQWLSGTKTTCGMQMFPYEDLNHLMNNESITWKIGVKIHDVQRTANSEKLDNTIMDDGDMFNTQMEELMNNHNVTKGWLVQFCQSLYQRNINLKRENIDLKRENVELRLEKQDAMEQNFNSRQRSMRMPLPLLSKLNKSIQYKDSTP